MSFKSGFVTLMGRPNVGKSTLLNNLAGEKIAIISKKAQTTRNAIRAVITEKDWQMIFVDTPGLHSPKTRLGKYMLKTVSDALPGGDVILFVTVAGDIPRGEEEARWLERVRRGPASVILVINKIDAHPKHEILKTISGYDPLLSFKTAVPVSALTGEGREELIKEILKLLPEGPKYYPDDTLTDQAERTIAAELIREKALLLLEEEVPHGIGVMVQTYHVRPDRQLVDIQADIVCDRESHKGIIIGKNGVMLKKIGTMARKEMENILGTPVNLQLWVKVREGWKNNPHILEELGYGKN
ncbi:MAG TPA: GTPase Era [Clostridiales bacterium]|nr:GTPase Era [Clostridiales bacterium]